MQTLLFNMNLGSSRPNGGKDGSKEYIVTWSIQDGWTALDWAEEGEHEVSNKE